MNYNDNPYNYNSQPAQDSEVFGWDDEIKEESSFVLLPEGDYPFRIKKFEKGRYNGGDKISACPKAIVTFSVLLPDGSETELTENYLLHKKMEWKLSEFFASVGLKKKNEPVRMLWTPELIGRQGVCKVIVHTYKKDGENKQTNRIDKLYPSYDQPAVSQPAQPSQQYQYQQPAQNFQSSQQSWNQGRF